MRLKYKECGECSGAGSYWIPNDDTQYTCMVCSGTGKELDLSDIERYNSDLEKEVEGDWILYEVLEEYVTCLEEEMISLSEHFKLVSEYVEIKKKYESQVKANKLLMDNYNGTN